jgi:hypothetical protein
VRGMPGEIRARTVGAASKETMSIRTLYMPGG